MRSILKIELFLCVATANIWVMTAQDPTCYKCCGQSSPNNYGHRYCNTSTEPTCHVTECSNPSTYAGGLCCFSVGDSYVDYCASGNDDWNCSNPFYHFCFQGS